MNEELAKKIGEMLALVNANIEFYETNSAQLSPPMLPKEIMRLKSESALHARALEDSVFETEFKQTALDCAAVELETLRFAFGLKKSNANLNGAQESEQSPILDEIKSQIAAANAQPQQIVLSIMSSTKNSWLDLQQAAKQNNLGKIGMLSQVAASLQDEFLRKYK